MPVLSKIKLTGFKTIQNLELEFRSLNVLIGANGAGKSNFVSFFEMLNHMMTDNLAGYVGGRGGASSHLYYGPKETSRIVGELEFTTEQATNCYRLELAHAAGDSFIFADEKVIFDSSEHDGDPFEASLGAGHTETQLNTIADRDEDSARRNTARYLRRLLRRCRVYHFHDTTRRSNIRQKVSTDRDRYLYDDAGNLAAFLYGLKHHPSEPEYYQRIVRTIRQVAPFFDDFDFPEPSEEPSYVQLDWREKDSEYPFGPHQLSDGTIRAMALITLLFQPEDNLPDLIILDEPELGFHPYAINVLGGLLEHAAQYAQVLVATQSPILVDQFEPEDLVIAQRDEKATALTRPDSEQLETWLEQYKLSELWEKNVLGGTP